MRKHIGRQDRRKGTEYVMKIDYIFDGSHDSPLIRLYSDQLNEITVLQSSIRELADNQKKEQTISNLPISSSKATLVFKMADSDSGIIISKDRKELLVELSKGTWLDICNKLDPFLVDQTGFAWLYESGSNSLLFTTDGYW